MAIARKIRRRRADEAPTDRDREEPPPPGSTPEDARPLVYRPRHMAQPGRGNGRSPAPPTPETLPPAPATPRAPAMGATGSLLHRQSLPPRLAARRPPAAPPSPDGDEDHMEEITTLLNFFRREDPGG